VNWFESNFVQYVNGPQQAFKGNIMLMRNEYIKFLDSDVSQIESELLCGPRSTSVEACYDRKNQLIKNLIVAELE
jgi:hypothetical protein